MFVVTRSTTIGRKKKNDVSSYDKIRRKKVVSWYREILMEGIEDKRKRERERERARE